MLVVTSNSGKVIDTMPFLIDGHNVIAALPDIDLNENYDEAKLVLKLRSWTARVRRRATVVFDGGVPGGQSQTLSSPDVEVVFAARKRTNADRIIRSRIRELPDAPNWTVVSSDHEILDKAREAGTRTITAQDFAYALNHPPKEDKEKPQTVSPAEVERWLEIFNEPDDSAPAPEETEATAAPTASQPASEPKDPPEKQKHAKRRPAHRRPPPRVKRGTRTIAEQLGAEEEPPRRSPEPPTGKPERVSDREVEEWLEIFGEPEESHVPPPKIPRRRRKKPVEPVVNKQGELSKGQVDAWLEVFGGEDTEPDQSRVANRPRVVSHRQINDKLAKHKENVASADAEEDDTALSEDDRDLWYSLFGDDSE
jgi:uncharacterized protein